MKRIKGLPHYKEGISSQLEWRDPKGKIHKVYHSFRSYAIGRGLRTFVKIEGVWYELDSKEQQKILW